MKSDGPEPNEDEKTSPAPRKTSGLAWALVILFFVLIAVDILSISMLGTNANATFSKIGKVPDTPVKQPATSHK